jgi:hypothetical protein
MSPEMVAEEAINPLRAAFGSLATTRFHPSYDREEALEPGVLRVTSKS